MERGGGGARAREVAGGVEREGSVFFVRFFDG